MSLRISTAMLHRQGVENMQRQQNLLAQTQSQISSGQRLRTAASSPSEWASAASLDRALAQLDNYRSNAATLSERLGYEDNALAGASEILARVRELAIQANGGAQGAAARAIIATELQGLRQDLLGIANTQDAESRYIFAGSLSAQPPFSFSGPGAAYDGDDTVRELDIAAQRSIADGDSGRAVFQSAGTQDVFATVQQLIDFSLAPNVTPAERTANQALFETALGELDLAQTHFSDLRGSIGSRLNAIEDAQLALAGNRQLAQEHLGELRDLDYAEATSRLALQQTLLQAAQLSYQRVQGLSLFDYLR